MATVVLCPTFGAGWQGQTTGGLPLNGGLINTYAAGTTTPTATYTTSLGNVQNANPIVLDSAGRPPAEIWLLQGQTYKFVVTDSVGANAQTFDNLPGINDASALIGNIFVSTLTPVPIAIVYGGTGQTTTNAALDFLHTSQGFVTAAATTNLNAVSSSYVQIRGNTLITAVTLTDGWVRDVEFQSTIAISSNSTLILPGATTITAVAGDTGRLRGEASGVVRMVQFQRASVAGTVTAATQGQVDAGTASTVFIAPSNRKVSLLATQATTSGTSKDFTIPAGATVIFVLFVGVSTNGTSNLLIQLGTGGGIEATNYVAGIGRGTTYATSTAGFILCSTNAATSVISGSIRLNLVDPVTFQWVSSGVLMDTATPELYSSCGNKATAQALTTVRITTVNGTDAFDAGLLGVSYIL